MKKAYAADFGAGNTSIFSINPASTLKKEITALNNPGGEPSGYVVRKNGSFLLGLGLYGITYEILKDIDLFHINIKAKPTEANSQEMIQYFYNWLTKIKKDHPEEFAGVDEEYWFIGCPTGGEWKKKETRDLYKNIFEQAGYTNVHIVPESNAALAFYQNKDKILEQIDSNTKLMLIDQGAYSLDATIFSNGTLSSYGGYLGASLVERMMVHTILYNDEESIRLKKRIINLPETIDAACKLLEKDKDGAFYTYLLLQARMLKEDYFTQLIDGKLNLKSDLTRTTDFEFDEEQLVLFANPVMMEEILEKKSVANILGSEFYTLPKEVQDELGSQSWMQAFRSFLNNIDGSYPEIQNADNNTIILVTGGGSLMNCVGDAIRKHFQKASVHADKEAILAIGKGLACWAPDKIEAIEFKNAFENFTNREEKDSDGDIINPINEKLGKVYVECVQQLLNDIVQAEVSAVTHGIEQWKLYNCSNTDIPKKIKQHLNDWVNNTGMPSFVFGLTSKIEKVKSELNDEFKKYVKAIGVPYYELLRADDSVFLSNSKKFLPSLFSAIVDEISSHYEKNEIWNAFPNKKNGFFSNPRAEFLNANADDLSKWIDKETDSTFDIAKNVFAGIEFDITGEVQMTMGNYFVVEARLDLINLMTKHINEILGKLVLEEYIED